MDTNAAERPAVRRDELLAEMGCVWDADKCLAHNSPRGEVSSRVCFEIEWMAMNTSNPQWFSAINNFCADLNCLSADCHPGEVCDGDDWGICARCKAPTDD